MSAKHDEARNLIVLCGETVVSAFQVIEGYREHVGKPLSVHLLATRKAHKGANRLKTALEALSPGLSVPVEIRDIADGLEEEGEGRPSAAEVYAEIERAGPVAVSISGGTNFLNVAALSGLSRPDAIFVQAADDAFYVTRQTGEDFETRRRSLPPSLSVETLFKLQDISWAISAKERRNALRVLCEDAGFPFPHFTSGGILTDVKVADQLFDAVWNAGDNILRFLIIRFNPYRGDAESRLAEARDILDLALDRKRLKRLFNRRITVMDEDRAAVERYQQEGRDKITAFHLYKASPGKTVSALRDTFAFYNRSKAPPSLPQPALTEFSGPVLVMALAPTPRFMLQVMGAHRAREVVLCADPSSKEITILAEVLRKKAESSGLGRVHVFPASPQGAELPGRLPKIEQPCAVNITPGTKGHGAFLALWAKTKGHEVWAVEPGAGRMLNLSEPSQSRALPNPPLPLLLDCLAPGCVKSYGLSRRSPDWDNRDGFYGAMLRFFHELHTAGRWAELWPLFHSNSNNMAVNDLNFAWVGDKVFELTGPAGDGRPDFSYKCELKGGEWFEKLTAEALAGLGEEYDPVVNVDIRRRTSDDRLTERDVVLSGPQGKLYVISCKSHHQSEAVLAAAAREVRACAAALDRFVVPLLHSMFIKGRRELEGVMLFGPDTLCRPDELRRCLEEAEVLLHNENPAP